MVLAVLTSMAFAAITFWMYVRGKEIDREIYNEMDSNY